MTDPSLVYEIPEAMTLAALERVSSRLGVTPVLDVQLDCKQGAWAVGDLVMLPDLTLDCWDGQSDVYGVVVALRVTP